MIGYRWKVPPAETFRHPKPDMLLPQKSKAPVADPRRGFFNGLNMPLTDAQKERNRKKRVVLNRLRNGATYQMAADLAGITNQTLSNWRKDDVEFDAKVQKARSGFGYEHLKRLGKHSRNGDATSTRMLVERHPSTREDFGRQEQTGSGVTINFNIPRNQAAIDVTPQKPAIEQAD